MIHITFSSSAAGTMRQMLRARGLKQKVVDLNGMLDWGPIANVNFVDRENWFTHHCPFSDGAWDWISESVAKFRSLVANSTERLIWIAPRSATEQSGLYWYLAQFGGENAKMIVADYAFNSSRAGEVPFSLGQLNQDLMGELFDNCQRIPWDSSRFSADRWQVLMNDNALLRIVDDGRLQSAKEDCFDSLLHDRCTDKWGKWHRVVADTMGDMWENGHSADDAFLLWRLRALIVKGAISCDGEMPRWGEHPSIAAKIRRA